MRRLRSSILSITAVALALGTAMPLFAMATTAPKADTLTLGREIKPFDEYILTASSVRISRVSMKTGKAASYLQDDTVRTQVSGLCSVVAVTEDGQEAVKKVTIRNAQSRYKDTLTDVLPTGTEVEARFSDAGPVYIVGTDTLEPDVVADLSGVIRSEGGLKSGTIMDPHKPVAPGDVWSIDTAAFAATLGPPPSNLKRTVTGTVRYDKIDTVDGTPVAIVVMEAKAANAFAEIDGVTARNATVTAHIELAVPLDKRFPAVGSATTTTMEADIGEAGQSIHFYYQVTDALTFRR
ncbi:MAG: hypothetical protein J5I53_06100 [Bradyrhizobiaceae bacterium]|nr:hypothetical protein [Bradyrhizobiaceae bacterium]